MLHLLYWWVYKPCSHAVPSLPHILDLFAAVDWKLILRAAVVDVRMTAAWSSEIGGC